MHIFIPEDFENLILKIDFSSNDIEKLLVNYELSFINIKNPIVEWEMKLPMFVPAFYSFILTQKKIPTQFEFYEYYLSINSIYFQENKFEDAILKAIRARVYRAFPSLIRDLHFTKYISEKFTKSVVMYNINLDIEKGIDLMVINENRFYGINLFVNTSRSLVGRSKKQLRHTYYENVIYVDVPLSFESSVKVGNFYLYGKKELESVINAMMKYKT